MPEPKSEYCDPLLEDVQGVYAGRPPGGRRVHVTLMACRPSGQHWGSSVDNPARCDCHRTEGNGTLCGIRHGGDAVSTKVTECYRSPKSALRALQHWAAEPDGTPQPALWLCNWTTMKSLLCQGEPDASALPLGSATYADGLDNGPFAEICRDSHLQPLMFCMEEGEALFSCPACGQLLRLTLLDNSARQGASELHGLPASANRA